MRLDKTGSRRASARAKHKALSAKQVWPKLGALGLASLHVSEDAGGAGLSRPDATLVFEVLRMAGPSVAAFLSIHNMCAGMLDTFAGDDL